VLKKTSLLKKTVSENDCVFFSVPFASLLKKTVSEKDCI